MKTEYDLIAANPEMYIDKYPFTVNLVLKQKKFERKHLHEYQNRVAELMAMQVIKDAKNPSIKKEGDD